MLDFESTSFCDFAFSSSGLCEDIFTVIAGNNRLGMAEDNIGLVAASTSDIHKIRVRSGNKSFKFVGVTLLGFRGI